MGLGGSRLNERVARGIIYRLKAFVDCRSS